MGIREAFRAMMTRAPSARPVPLPLRYVNKRAPAITDRDIADAAAQLNVTPAHIRMVMKVESGGKSFDDKGRPLILFEPHVFHKRTGGKYSPAPYSYRLWGSRPYPSSYDGRWTQMADAASKDEKAALESASWGLFQIMGYHWKALGYASVQDFAEKLTQSEGEHLKAVVRFIEANGIAGALRRCEAGKPNSCRDFARHYNGPGFDKNRYAEKMAEALR